MSSCMENSLFMELRIAWLTIMNAGPNYSELVLRILVDVLACWLGSKFTQGISTHYSYANIARFAPNCRGYFVAPGLTVDCRLYTSSTGWDGKQIQADLACLPVYIIGGSKATNFRDARLYTPTLTVDRSFQKIFLEFQVTGNFTMAPPPPEPPDMGHKWVNANAIYLGLRFVVCYEVVIFRYSLNFVKDWGCDWSACSISHRGIFLFTCESALLVDSLVTSFIENGMLEAISMFILLLQMHMRLHKAPFVIMLPVCASIDENVAYCCGRNNPCYCCYESYWIGPKIMQENRVLIDELLHATRCITGTYDQIALLDLCSKIGDVGTTQQGWHGLLKMILDCSNSLFVGYIKIVELDGK